MTKIDYENIEQRVDIGEVKAQLNIEKDYTEEDDYFEGLVAAASDLIKGLIGCDVAIIPREQTWTDTAILRVNECPLKSIDSIVADTETLEDYEIDEDYHGFTVQLEQSYEKIIMTYKTGYEVLPPALKQAIMLKAASLYDGQRTEKIVGTILSDTGIVDQLIADYKRRY